MKALVIDDSKAMRTILSKMIAKIGFEVVEACHGREALQCLNYIDHLPKLILVDWNMPEMNGLEFVRSVRADPRYREVRIMMVTTESEMGRVVEALEVGVDEYIMKPFTEDVIKEKLQLLEIPVNECPALEGPDTNIDG